MSREPIFVTDMMIAKGAGFVIATLNAPAGDFRDGKIETLEIVRVVMSINTLAAVSALLQKTCQELGVPTAQNVGLNGHSHNGAPDPERANSDANTYQLIAKPVRH